MNPRPALPPWLRGLLARRLARPPRAPAPPVRRRACLFKLDRLGDFVLATGALRLLMDHFGPPHCRLVISEVAAPLAAAEFPEVARWIAPAGAAGVWRDIRPVRARCAPAWAGERFDELVCLRHTRSLYRDLALCWLDADRWHGVGERPTPGTLALADRPGPANDYPDAATPPWSRELLAHREVARRVLAREVGWEEVRPRLRSVRVQSGGEIVFCPFGADRIRDYPPDAWLAAWRAALEPDAVARLVGPGSRRDDLERLAHELRGAGARVEVLIDVPHTDFVRLIAGARLVLTVESAAAHLATALDQPAVIVTGGGHFGWFGPWGDAKRQRWVHHPLDCYGCNWQCRRARVECLTEMPGSAVATAIKEVLPHG
ncbi:MAG: hypothetical protein HZA93_15250 [Verrucomicrobia bacterium]|nr:hypothetical protein [Verrucomicrobiota bacterium]